MRQLGLRLKLFLCLHWNSSIILVYALKVVTADAMQQVKETQAVLGANAEGTVRVGLYGKQSAVCFATDLALSVCCLPL